LNERTLPDGKLISRSAHMRGREAAGLCEPSFLIPSPLTRACRKLLAARDTKGRRLRWCLSLFV
jgi:hypothetical protein